MFIGQDLDEPEMRARLDRCLLDERTAVGTSKDWGRLSNPFPDLETD